MNASHVMWGVGGVLVGFFILPMIIKSFAK